MTRHGHPGVRVLLLSVALLSFLTVQAGAQTASLVADINVTPDYSSWAVASSPRDFLAAAGKVFFVADEPSSGTEPWVSDGTAAGTEMLADICAGTCSSAPQSLVEVGGVIFWVAHSQESSGEVMLWRSDGTRAGTFALTPPEMPVKAYDKAAVLGRQLLFSACPSSDCALWRTDGTLTGTVKVHDLLPYNVPPHHLTTLGGRLFFLMADPLSLRPALWVTDGTEAGTTVVKQIDGDSYVSGLIAAGGKLFFFSRGEDLRNGRELWVSDGTEAGTRPITQFAPEDPFPIGGWLKAIGGRVYFVANDVVNGYEIWRSDGTPAGTVRVTDFGFYRPVEGLHSGQLAEIGGRLVYVATDGINGPKLWATGATPAATTALADLCPGPNNCTFNFVLELVGTSGRIVFLVQNASQDVEIWSTDGTPQGTRRLRNTCSRTCGIEPRLWAAGGAVFFFGSKQEIWRTNGRAAGTKLYADLPAGVELDDNPALAAIVGQTLFFAAGPYGEELELWTSDGKTDGTRPLADIAGEKPSSSPRELRPVSGEQIFFSTCDDQGRRIWQSSGSNETTAPLYSGPPSECNAPQKLTVAGQRAFFVAKKEIWSSDGTAAGTIRLLSTDLPAEAIEIAVLQGHVYMTSSQGETMAIWKSDGTVQGTVKAVDLPAGVFPRYLTAAGDHLYFTAASGQESGIEVWRSDGTQVGTRTISHFQGAFRDDGDPQFTRLGGDVFFIARVDDFGAKVWKTDGTPSGTQLFVDASGYVDPNPTDLTVYRGFLYFFASVPDQTRVLWRSNGTPSGTAPVYEFTARGAFGVQPSDLTVLGNQLFFSARDDIHGLELWQSDGTRAGTRIVRDIVPGSNSSRPQHLTAVAGKLFFSAGDRSHGFELWQSDGTEAGTRMVQDLAPGAASSYPEEFTGAGNRLYFSADDGYSGRELWTLPLAVGPGCQPSSNALCLGGRFKVEAFWRAQGQAGRGTAVGLTADTGYFWFFGPDNVEVVLKVLDGRIENGHHWVFYGALSDVEYALTVTDTQTGAAARYVNLAGRFASVGDVTGFGNLGAFSTKRVEKTAPPSPPALIAERFDPAAIGPCQAGPTRLCLNGGRFAVEATWKAQGRTDAAQAVPLTADTGYFWFFGADNVEVVLKVLDGRGYNGRFWVFYGALSDVEYTLTVTDTQTGQVKTYANPQGRFASVGDTGAF